MELLFITVGLATIILLLRKNARLSRLRSGWVDHKSEREPPKITHVIDDSTFDRSSAKHMNDLGQ